MWGRYSRKAELQLDLIAHALTCGITRVVSFMHWNSGGEGGPDERFLKSRWPGADWQQHNQAHAIPSGGHRDGVTAFDIMNAFTQEHLTLFRRFLKRLKAAPGTKVGASVLDESVVYLGSEMGYGPWHNLDDFPALVAGHAGGALAGGRAFAFDNQKHIGNWLVTLLQKAGVPSPALVQDTPTSSPTVYDQPITTL